MPHDLNDTFIVHTPGISGNCLLYTLARHVQENPTHDTVRQLRKDFGLFLLSRADSIYCPDIFPLSLYCLTQGELFVHNVK